MEFLKVSFKIQAVLFQGVNYRALPREMTPTKTEPVMVEVTPPLIGENAALWQYVLETKPALREAL